MMHMFADLLLLLIDVYVLICASKTEEKKNV